MACGDGAVPPAVRPGTGLRGEGRHEIWRRAWWLHSALYGVVGFSVQQAWRAAGFEPQSLGGWCSSSGGRHTWIMSWGCRSHRSRDGDGKRGAANGDWGGCVGVGRGARLSVMLQRLVSSILSKKAVLQRPERASVLCSSGSGSSTSHPCFAVPKAASLSKHCRCHLPPLRLCSLHISSGCDIGPSAYIDSHSLARSLATLCPDQ